MVTIKLFTNVHEFCFIPHLEHTEIGKHLWKLINGRVLPRVFNSQWIILRVQCRDTMNSRYIVIEKYFSSKL